MSTDDAITELLDSRRLLGLATNDSGRILATYSELNSEGNTTVTRLADIGGERPVRLTRGSASVGPVALADDGTILFASKRAGDDGKDPESPSLWALPTDGEARKIADHDGGFSRIDIAGETVVVQFPVHTWAGNESDHATFSKERTEAKVTAILHAGFPVRRWDHDLGPARETLGVAKRGSLPDEFSDSQADHDLDGLTFTYLDLPPGRLVDWALDEAARFVLVQVEKPIPGQLEAAEIWKVSLDGSHQPQRLTEAAVDHSFGINAISPDGTKALVTRETFWTPRANLSAALAVVDLSSGQVSRVWPGADYFFDPIWLDDHTIVATADDQGRGSVFIGDLNEEQPRRLAGGPGQKYAFSEAKRAGGSVVATASAIDVAPHPVRIDTASGQVTALANPAGVLPERGTLTEVTTTAADGTEIRAWLAMPAGDGPHPLVVFAHGGPWGSWNAWTYRWNPGPFVAAGYAILLPDPAISTGYGQSMIDRGQQELGGAPFTDIMALTDATVARSDIDAERTAFAGGSYGGYMANWVAGHTGDRFACIVTHASLWNTTSMGRTTDNSSWDVAMKEQAAQYSPHLFASEIAVPMLVIHGDKDYRVPIGQGQELWYDLLSVSKTPLGEDGLTQHRFLYYPDEGHWIAGRGNAEVWYRTFLAFLDKHVLGKDVERMRALG